MERPSHSVFRSDHVFANRLVSTTLAICVPLAIVLVLLHSLVGTTIKYAGPLTYVPDNTKVAPSLLAPPPPPPMQHPTVIDVPPPIFNTYNPSTDDHTVVTGTTRGTDLTPPQLQPAGPDRAAAGIIATHTIPPYPLIAMRLGEQGNVTLRLTVTADGHVAKADIVTSSGSHNLDDAAQQWILAHWRYRPALDKGQPVASQAVATVIFNLKDIH